MYFVKNFINKLSRKDRKEQVPIKYQKEFWDKKHVMTGKDLCNFRGHLWKSTTENGRKKAVCQREGCNAEFWVDGNGVIS